MNPRTHSIRRCPSPFHLTAILYPLLLLPLAQTAQAVTTLDVEGQQALGLAPGIKYWSVGSAILSPNGLVTFAAGVGASSTGLLSTAAYIGSPNNFQLFASEGNPLLTGTQFRTSGPVFTSLSNLGTGVGLDFFAVPNNGASSPLICYGNASSFIAIAATGQAAPSGGSYSGIFSNPIISADGQVAFASDLTSAFAGVFLYSQGTTSTVALSGDSAPGLSGTFFQFNNDPNISDGGHVTFIASTKQDGGVGPVGIWSGTPGSLQLIAATTTAAPGAGPGATFATFYSRTPPVNRAGKLAFSASLIIGGAVNSTNNSGIWTNLSGNLTLVARQGDQAPGFPAGVKFGNLSGGQSLTDPVLNNQGVIAFEAPLTGSTAEDAIFAGTPGAVLPIVIAGQPVPGLPSSVSTTDFYDLSMNAVGQMVFYADLSGASLNQFNSNAIIGYDPTYGLRLIAWGGTFVPGTGIPPLNGVGLFPSDGENHPTVLSDSGLVAFTVFSPAGNRIFVTAIPEPRTLPLFVIPALALLTRRRSPCNSIK